MANIAVICEGVSEFNILNHIVGRHNKNHFLNAVQPKIDPNNEKQADEGGWSRVLDHCTDEVFEQIFQLNDYLIIQIDTDSSHIQPYSIDQRLPDGSAKSPERLHAEIKARLMKNITRGVRKKYLKRIFFAICHNEIECWLLPVYYKDKRGCRSHNCIYLLNAELSKHGIPCIPNRQKNSPNAKKAYRAILKNIRKKDDVISIARESRGFSSFVKGLDTIPDTESE